MLGSELHIENYGQKNFKGILVFNHFDLFVI